jgi:carbon monoxide dehydrogenase subunit G
MDLEHSFTVPVPEERAWNVLLDVERVAPCMPGATLDSVDGDVISGRIKVKVGPIAMTYAGTARFVERDPNAHYITLEASGKETRGAGTASAKIRSMLEGEGDETHVIVHTSLNVTGKPAQFGRGVMSEVGGKLIGIFAANLAEMLTADQAGGAAEAGAAGERDDAAALPLEELQLPLRSYNSLRRVGVHTVGELSEQTAQQLLEIENIGPASVDEIRQRLAERGLTLREADGAPAEAAAGAAADASANGRAGGLITESTGAEGEAPDAAASDDTLFDAAASGTSAAGTAASTTPASVRAAEAWSGSTPAGSAPADNVAADTVSAGSTSGYGASAAPPRVTPQPFAPTRPGDDDAIDLLSVAGMPVLKRAIPPLAVLIAVILVVLGVRRRRRRADG